MIHATRADVVGGHERNYERFARVADKSECWSWVGPHDRYGYSSSQVTANGEKSHTSGHRVAYLLHRGDIADGLVLDHLCRNRWCVNPWHLEPVTNHENTIRQRLSGLCRSGRHEMTPENTYTAPNGHHVRCRECMRESNRKACARRRLRQKAVV